MFRYKYQKVAINSYKDRKELKRIKKTPKWTEKDHTNTEKDTCTYLIPERRLLCAYHQKRLRILYYIGPKLTCYWHWCASNIGTTLDWWWVICELRSGKMRNRVRNVIRMFRSLPQRRFATGEVKCETRYLFVVIDQCEK